MTFAVTPTYNSHQAKYYPKALSTKGGQSTRTGSEAFIRCPSAHVHCALEKIPSPSAIQMLHPHEMINHMPPLTHAFPFEMGYHCADHVINAPVSTDFRFRMKPHDSHLQRPASAAVNLPKVVPRVKTEELNRLSELKVKFLGATLRHFARKSMMRSWVELRSNTSMSLVRDSMKEIVATMSISDYAERVKVLFVPDTYEHSSVASEDSSPTDISDFDKNALPSMVFETNTDQTGYKQPNVDDSQNTLIKHHVTQTVEHQRSLESENKFTSKNTHVVTKDTKQTSRGPFEQMRAHGANSFKFHDIQETDSLVSGATDTESTYTPRYIVEQRKREAEARRNQMAH